MSSLNHADIFWAARAPCSLGNMVPLSQLQSDRNVKLSIHLRLVSK